MNSFRSVKDDILKNWLCFREEDLCSFHTLEDKNHYIKFEEISEEIIKNIPTEYHHFIKSKLNNLEENVMDYIDYWNEKYYRNGFCDGIELISGCLTR